MAAYWLADGRTSSIKEAVPGRRLKLPLGQSPLLGPAARLRSAVASFAFATQVYCETCANKRGCYERELVYIDPADRKVHLPVFIHRVDLHSPDAHTFRSEEAMARRRERRKDTKLKRAARAQRCEEHDP